MFLFTEKPESLRSNELYSFIMQCLAINIGKVVTPSLITTTINKRLCRQFTTNKTVSNYLDKLCEANIVHKLDRDYICLSDTEPSKLSYNRTYYFSDFSLFEKFYDLALKGLFQQKLKNELPYHIALAKMMFYHKSLNEGYRVKSGVLSFFSHLEKGKTKQNTLSFDFVLKGNNNEIYVVFKNGKDSNDNEFTIEAKFALQHIIHKLSIMVVTDLIDFNIFESDNIRYVSIDEILSDKFKF